LPALEYKTYYDIRFEKHPSIKKIVESIEKIVKINKSTRLCATLVEFCAAQPTIEGNKERAAHFYAMAAEPNCVIGLHWMGVYYMECHGVAMNLDKSEAMLLKAHKWATPSQHFSYFCYTAQWNQKRILKKLTFISTKQFCLADFFRQHDEFFKENFDLLAPVFC
jgi:hypothetical protein